MPVYDDKKTAKKNDMPHSLVLEERNRLSISGVEDVDNFDEQMVELYTSQGLLTIKGENLHINQLSVEAGEVAIEGEISFLEYSSGEFKKGGAGFFGKLFK